jgi:hypothetical protein
LGSLLIQKHLALKRKLKWVAIYGDYRFWA